MSFGATGSVGDTSSATATAGFSRFTHSGYEFGGDVFAIVTSGATVGTVFGRAGRNFIGESRTVPFVTGAIGAPIGGWGGYMWEGGEASGGSPRTT